MASRQRECYIGIIVTSVIASIAIGLRLYARNLKSLRLALDDYLCIAAYIFALVSSGLMLEWTFYGLGRFLQDVQRPPEIIVRDSLLRLWILEFTYAYSLGFSKFSILALYWHLFGFFSIRIPIISLMVATVVWLLCRTFLGLFHCIPPQAFWETTLRALCPIDDTKFEFGTVVVHVFLDVTIFTMPVFVLHNLTFQTFSEKIAVVAMFLSGAFVCVVSIVNLTQLYAFLDDGSSLEVLWNTAPPALWGTIEINMAILAVSLPLMRPVATKISRVLLPAQAESRNGSYAAQGQGWVHIEWLRKITSNISGMGESGRRTVIADVELALSHHPEVPPQAVPPQAGRPQGLFEMIHRLPSQESTIDTIPVFGFRPILQETG